jgi:hypothetical protein
MTDRIDRAVERMQAPRLDPPVDRIVAQADLSQLLSTDDPVLPCRDDRNRGIESARFTLAADSAVGVNLALHGGSIARSVLQRCANCHC